MERTHVTEKRKARNILLPYYESILKCLNKIDILGITELKSFSKPPELAKLTIEVVAIILGSEK